MRIVAVPVKSLDRTKSRLAPVLSSSERARLAMAMFEDVLDACLNQQGWEPWVISRSEAVLQLANRRGVRPLAEAGTTLLQAIRQVEAGTRIIDCSDLAIVLADLPLLTTTALAMVLAQAEPVVAAPSISDGGTNVLVRRPPSIIRPRFGRSSFEKHRHEAYRRGVTFKSITGGDVGFDLDRPEDLVTVLGHDRETRTRTACVEMGLAARLRMDTRL
jgi:2-phospho-L-lactate guanylyltransferase